MKTYLTAERRNSALLWQGLNSERQNYQELLKAFEELKCELMQKGEDELGRMRNLRGQLNEAKSQSEAEWRKLKETLDKFSKEMTGKARTSSDYNKTMLNLGNPAVQLKGELHK